MDLSFEKIKAYRNAYENRPALKAASLAISKQPVDEVAFDQNAANKVPHLYNHEIKTMKVTNQKHSGRCWLFAALNVLRERVAAKCDIEQFELSQNYMAFWDKVEKSNYVLESILNTLDQPNYSRLLDYILETGVQDGGQWDMFANLVKKHGVVPKSVMPETFLSENTRSINHTVNIKLRRAAAVMRGLHASGAGREELEKIQAETMDEIFSIMCAAFGCPPETFDWEYKNAKGDVIRIEGLTPISFFNDYIGFRFEDYISLINAPTKDKPYGKKYTVRYLGNVVGGDPVTYINTDMATMKKAIMKQIDAGETVWFGSDVGWFMDRTDGRMVMDVIDYSALFGGFDFSTTKEQKLDMRMSAMNHAMTICGYHDVNGIPQRFKIQNSWGDEKGDKGYYAMSDAWFDEFVYQALVRKEFLPEELVKAIDSEPIVLEPWDPMGTLAD